MKTTHFLGHECVSLNNAALNLLATKSVGPRIISLRLGAGDNLFAELSNSILDCPGVGAYHLYGGHRLWHAPEVPRRTYLPDDDPVDITLQGSGLLVAQSVEPETGIQKSISIRLPHDGPTVIVDHFLTNQSLWPVEFAPWAITMLKPGGVAVLPQPNDLADPAGAQPNRVVALWPYTDVRSPYIAWGNQFIFVRAHVASEADVLKLGFPNPRGWLAYHWRDTLFVKYSRFDPEANYYDLGSSSQCFCGPDTLELETLGPRVHIHPGETVTHREVWRIFGNISFSQTDEAVQGLVEELALDENAQFLQ